MVPTGATPAVRDSKGKCGMRGEAGVRNVLVVAMSSSSSVRVITRAVAAEVGLVTGARSASPPLPSRAATSGV